MEGPRSGQELLPARELVPDAHAVHRLDPVNAAFVPAAQEVHTVVALLVYVPSVQGVNPALVADGTQYAPVGAAGGGAGGGALDVGCGPGAT